MDRKTRGEVWLMGGGLLLILSIISLNMVMPHYTEMLKIQEKTNELFEGIDAFQYPIFDKNKGTIYATEATNNLLNNFKYADYHKTIGELKKETTKTAELTQAVLDLEEVVESLRGLQKTVNTTMSEHEYNQMVEELVEYGVIKSNIKRIIQTKANGSLIRLCIVSIMGISGIILSLYGLKTLPKKQSTRENNTAIAMAFSMILPGAGQMYLGEYVKGLGFMAITIPILGLSYTKYMQNPEGDYALYLVTMILYIYNILDTAINGKKKTPTKKKGGK